MCPLKHSWSDMENTTNCVEFHFVFCVVIASRHFQSIREKKRGKVEASSDKKTPTSTVLVQWTQAFVSGHVCDSCSLLWGKLVNCFLLHEIQLQAAFLFSSFLRVVVSFCFLLYRIFVRWSVSRYSLLKNSTVGGDVHRFTPIIPRHCIRALRVFVLVHPLLVLCVKTILSLYQLDFVMQRLEDAEKWD